VSTPGLSAVVSLIPDYARISRRVLHVEFTCDLDLSGEYSELQVMWSVLYDSLLCLLYIIQSFCFTFLVPGDVALRDVATKTSSVGNNSCVVKREQFLWRERINQGQHRLQSSNRASMNELSRTEKKSVHEAHKERTQLCAIEWRRKMQRGEAGVEIWSRR
jgi:hypothetical protein